MYKGIIPITDAKYKGMMNLLLCIIPVQYDFKNPHRVTDISKNLARFWIMMKISLQVFGIDMQ